MPTAVPRGLSVPTRVVNHRGGRTWVPVGVGTKRSKKVFGRPMDGDLFCGGLRVAESTGPSLLRRIAVLEVRRLIADLCANVIRSAASSCSTQVRASAGRWGGGFGTGGGGRGRITSTRLCECRWVCTVPRIMTREWGLEGEW